MVSVQSSGVPFGLSGGLWIQWLLACNEPSEMGTKIHWAYGCHLLWKIGKHSYKKPTVMLEMGIYGGEERGELRSQRHSPCGLKYMDKPLQMYVTFKNLIPVISPLFSWGFQQEPGSRDFVPSVIGYRLEFISDVFDKTEVRDLFRPMNSFCL